MASELKLRLYGKYTKGTLVREMGFNSDQSIDVAGSTPVLKTQVLSTTLEALDFGDAGETGYVWIYNRSAIVITITAGGSDLEIATLPANTGQLLLYRYTGTTYKAKGASGTPTIEFVALPA